MSVVIIDTLARGGTGDAPFPVILEGDAKISYLTVADIATRDTIPEWKRSAGIRVHVLADGTDYRLGTDVTITGQVWGPIGSSSAFQLLAEKNSAGGYVGLESDGFINPQYIKAIFSSTSYVVASAIERNSLSTITGDIVVQTDTSQTWVKLNNNPATTTDADFALLSVAATVLSVNGNVGTVTIDFSSMIAQTGSQTAFETAVANTPSVSGNTSQTANNTNDIVAIYAILAGLGAATEVNIPLYSGGVIYNSGDNVIYGATGKTNLYRVLDSVTSVTNVLPTDISNWERVGDFYTQDEVDALLLNLTATPDFNWNRPIKKLPEVGQIPGSTKLIEGTEEIYYGRIDATAEILSINALQIGELISPTINGKVLLGDGLNIQQITILDDTGADVGNPTFIGTAAINEFNFQVNTPITITGGSLLKYSIKIDVTYTSLLPTEEVNSELVDITTVFPILFGNGTTNLNAVDKYTNLNKLVELDGNKTVIVNSNTDKLYYCIPEEYADRVSVVDEGGNDILGSLFPNTPVIEVVNSSGLSVDWTHNYKVYQANYNTDSSNIHLTFILNREDSLNTGDNTLDDILEGVVNKHLTKALKEKLVNFNGGDYLTKATYDPNLTSIVENALQLVIIGVNNTGTIIPAFTLVTFNNLNLSNGQVEVQVASKDTPIIARGMIVSALGVGLTGRVIREGFVAPIDTSGRQVEDEIFLDSSGGFTYTAPTSGIIQLVGRVLSVGVTGSLFISPQSLDSGMLSEIYDPQSIDGDVFDMDNMTEGATNKLFIEAEKIKLAGVEDDATADQAAVDVVYDNTDSRLTEINVKAAIDELAVTPTENIVNYSILATTSTITTGIYFEQTNSGITNKLPATPTPHRKLTIMNFSGGTNTIEGNSKTILGDSNISIFNGETMDFIYNGTEWKVI